MKKLQHSIFFSSVILLFGLQEKGNAQDAVPIHYRFKSSIELQECSAGGKTTGSADTPPDGSKFKISGIKDATTYIIRFWDWKQSDSEKREVQKERNELYETFNKGTKVLKTKGQADRSVTYQRYFLISKEELSAFAEPIAPKVAPLLGAATMPFKWRPQRGTFNDGLTISAMGGWNFSVNRNTDHSMGLVLGLGLSTVDYDASSTYTAPDEASKSSAVSISGGLLYQWQRLQLMVLGGVDCLQQEQRANWVYHGKPWIGLGIGAGIFNHTTGEVTEKKQGTTY